MLATYTPAVLTPLTFQQSVEALRWALGDAGIMPDALALALAKTALETGRWQKMWCFNWGNIKAGDSYAGMYCCIRLNEVLGGKVVWFDPDSEGFQVPPGHPQTRMRAYANEWDGADQYARFLQLGRYRKAWGALLTGNAVAYVHELKVAGYFTADEATYAKGVRALQQEFLAKLRGLPHEEYDVTHLHAEVERLQQLWWASVQGEAEAVA